MLLLIAICVGATVLAFLWTYIRWELVGGSGADVIVRNAAAIALFGVGVGVLIWTGIGAPGVQWSRGRRATIASVFGATIGFVQGGLIGTTLGATLGLVAGAILVVAVDRAARKNPRSDCDA